MRTQSGEGDVGEGKTFSLLTHKENLLMPKADFWWFFVIITFAS